MITPTDVEGRKRQLQSDLDWIRKRTFSMTSLLTDDDLHKQHTSIMSPVVWDMGHVANFEELWLLRRLDGRAPHDITRDELYNPFDNPRWCRGELPILDRAEASNYLDEVRGEALAILAKTDLRDPDPLIRDGYVFDMTVQHEAQHQETILQALDLRPDLEAYEPATTPELPAAGRSVDDEERVRIEAGSFDLGTDDVRSAYDNERPRHRVHVPRFEIDRYPVTARRYAAFIEAGGYKRRELWAGEGWAWLQEHGHRAPQGWIPDVSGGWLVRVLGHIRPLDAGTPVQHVSFWEAEAFARWTGGRLPNEAEWEKAAAWDPVSGQSTPFPWGKSPPSPHRANLDHALWGPAPIGSYPQGASAYGIEQMLGDVYQWTTSEFSAYPGYSTFPYPEYSEVFFDEGYKVLRGASWATSRVVARNTFRNWDLAVRKQIFSGIRLAWDVD